MSGAWEVIHGDCLGVMGAMRGESVDAIITDPPYGHNNNNGDLIHRRESALGRGEAGAARPIANDGREANEVFRAAIPAFARLLRAGCCCCCGGGPDPQFARWSLWLDECLDFKQMVVWDKGPMGMGWHYRRSYETVLVAQKAGAACAWYDTTNKVENIIRPGFKGIRKIIPAHDDHPTPKPVELALHFIELHTKPGDTVLDPFCGHGWVGVACMMAGRKFIGVELDAGFVEKARARIGAEASQGKLGFVHA